MKLAAICCTYVRPKALAAVIECFLRQDYPVELRELIVLDDAGQYANQAGNRWRLVSSPVRFRTLGEKRNASAALVSPDVDAYCVWDDDDIYLPWHMAAAAAALKDADYTIPTVIYIDRRGGLERKANHSNSRTVKNGGKYLASCASVS
jgi:glycosyltransferase involved in cell wall biosynthesis